jgi:hypothetical protein
LLGLAGSELQHALFAGVDELIDAIRFDGGFGAHLQFALDFDFHPEPLAIEAVLIALVVAGHCEVALEDVFVGASPRVVHAHWVVGGDRPVDKAPPRLAGILRAQLAEDLRLPPEAQDVVLAADEIRTGDFFKHDFAGVIISSGGTPNAGTDFSGATEPPHPQPLSRRGRGGKE